MQSPEQSGRRIIAGKSIRWDEEQAKAAYAQGHWVHETLADTLKQIATKNPERILVVDGAVQLDAHTLQEQAEALARVMLRCFPVGSVISFMLPNWHETAVIYLATTLAGMIAHPILPSLREHDLRYMLKDVDSRMIFIPEQFRQHDYANMLANVIATLETPPQVVVLRGDTHQHIAYEALFQDIDSQARIKHPLPTVDANAVRMIMYTSGTTGNPKGGLVQCVRRLVELRLQRADGCARVFERVVSFNQLCFPPKAGNAAFLEAGIDQQIIEMLREQQQQPCQHQQRRIAQQHHQILAEADHPFHYGASVARVGHGLCPL